MAAAQLLQDMRILCTNLSDRERAYVQKLAQQQGAVCLATAAPHDPPHVLITRRAGSPKYTTVLRRNSATPVVIPEWLTDSVHAGRRLAYDKYAAGALLGLTVCFSGLPVPQKSSLAKEVLRLGGVHSPNLTQDCTHLVTVSADSEKYRFAQRKSIPCVTPEWLTASAAQGWCQDDHGFEVAAGAGQHQPQQKTSQMAEEALTAALHGNTRGDVSVSDTGRPLDAALSAEFTAGTVGQRGASCPVREGTGTPPPGEGAAAAAGPAWDDLNCDDDAPLFMEVCFLWCTGCTPSEAFETVKLCRLSGAKRFVGDPPAGLITHIVVGSQLSAGEGEDVARYWEEHRQVAVVHLEWLRRSFARKHVLPADERFAVAPAALAGARRLEASAVLAAAGAGGSGAADIQLGGAAGAVPAPPRLAGGAAEPCGFLEQCYFTLAAVKGTPAQAAAEAMIRAHGGRTFNASLPSSVAARRARAFAICPPSLPPTAAAALRAAHPDFAAVEEGGRHTLYWLQCCQQAGRLLAPQREAPCYSPLPYALPLPGMENVSVAISGFDTSVRAAIQHTVQAVGGRVSVDYMSSRDTHLIVAAAKGDKYRHAARLGVIPVTTDWLVDSVTQGRLQPPENYRPRLPPGGAPALSLPGGSIDGGGLSRGGSGSGGPSQIGATQLPGAGAGMRSLFQAVASGPGRVAGQPLLPDTAAAIHVPVLGPALAPLQPPELANAPRAGAPSAGGSGGKGLSLLDRAKRIEAARKRQPSHDENAGGPVQQVAAPLPAPAAAPGSQERHAAAAALPAGGFDFESLFGGDDDAAGGDAATGAAMAAVLAPAPAAASPASNETPAADRPAAATPGEAADAAGRSSSRKATAKGRKSVAPRFGSRLRAAAAGVDAEASVEREDDGEDLAAMVNDLASAMDRARAKGTAAAPVLGSQQGMPPPPPRARSARSGGGGGGEPARSSKRPRMGDGEGGDPPVRRSGRRKAGSQEEDMLEMSQQVGYESAPAVIAAGAGAGGAAAHAAKQRLRAVTRLAGNGSNPKDALDML